MRNKQRERPDWLPDELNNRLVAKRVREAETLSEGGFIWTVIRLYVLIWFSLKAELGDLIVRRVLRTNIY